MDCMGVKQISVEVARQRLEAAGAVYVDVRTPAEFDRGHPPGAINIPVVFPDPQTRRMTPNPEFLEIVLRHVPKSATVIVGCQMGGRSQLAAEAMAGSGYTDVSNMQGGFGGAKSPMGEVAVPGWMQLGYPVENDTPPGSGYEDLKNA